MSAENNKTPEELLQEQQEKIDQLQAELKRQEDDHAAKVADIHQAYRSGKKPPVEIVGTVDLTLIKPGTKSSKIKKTVRFAPGFPKIRLEGTTVVQTRVLLKVAQGETLTEDEQAANPGLADWDKAQAINFLTEMAAIGVSWLVEAEQ